MPIAPLAPSRFPSRLNPSFLPKTRAPRFGYAIPNSTLSTNVTSSPPLPTNTNQAQTQNNGKAFGPVIGGLLGLVAVLCLVFGWVTRPRR